MYDYIKGHLVSKQLKSYRGSHIVLETGGIGYLVLTSKSTIEKIGEADELKVYVSLHHKEDAMYLTGFLTKEERDIFNLLRSVSGVGVKTSFGILEEFSVSQLIDIIIREDAKELSKAKGIGSKAAQKIVIELKDKLINRADDVPETSENIQEASDIPSKTLNEVKSVLVSLGYSVSEAQEAVKNVLNYKKDASQPEDILKYSLEYLAHLDEKR